MIADVADEEIARRIELDAVRLLEGCFPRGAAVAAVAGLARAREGRDDAGFQRDFAHGVVAHVHDVEVAGLVEADFVREVERGLQRRPAIAGVALLPAARDDVQLAVGRDLAHALTAVFAEPDVAVRPAHDAEGIVELCLRRRAAVPGGTLCAVTSKSGDGRTAGGGGK